MNASAASVVIPTRDRPGALARCLAAVREQRGVDLEVIVVDDGSLDAMAVERVVGAYDSVRLVRLGGRGPAAARNAGLRAATAGVVLLMDDDCVAQPGWAFALVHAVRRTGALAAGRTLHDSSRPFVVASETIVTHAERTQRFAATRNVCVPRVLALDVPFDERFREAGGEDREWCRRLADQGTPFVRVPDAVVVHEPEISFGRFWRQQARYGRAARIDGAAGTGVFRSSALLVATGFLRGPRTGALVSVAQVAAAFGYLGGRGR